MEEQVVVIYAGVNGYLDALPVASGRLVGESARQEIITREAGGNFHDIARVAELFYCLSEYDFHWENSFSDR
jgi:hypothetical protein